MGFWGWSVNLGQLFLYYRINFPMQVKTAGFWPKSRSFLQIVTNLEAYGVEAGIHVNDFTGHTA